VVPPKRKIATDRVSLDVKDVERQLDEQQRILEYDTKEYTVEFLVYKLGAGDDASDIYIPGYQRQFNWDDERQSRFIESLLVGLPIPFLFFGDNDGRLEVVDGLQRLRTCHRFLSGNLALSPLERLPLLEGFRFGDLPPAQQRRFKNRTIRSVVLSQTATEEDRRDLFDRINTGSLIATSAEVRRGKLPGPVNDLIDKLAKDHRFLALCPMTERSAQFRTREDYITRFFAFADNVADDLPGYKDRVGEYLDGWLKGANEKAHATRGLTTSLHKRFASVMAFVQQHFPNGFAKKPNSNFTPAVRFDSIAVGVDWALQTVPTLTPARQTSTWLGSDQFLLLTTSNAANVRSKILARVEYVRTQLLVGQDNA